MKRRDSALVPGVRGGSELSERWRPLNGGQNLTGLVGGLRSVQYGILTELAGEGRGGSRSLVS